MKFTKMHANGNDYIYIDTHSQKVAHPEKYARFLCDRHFGVGGDGLVLLCHSEEGDFRMRIFDPDGTEAELCGNALQCSGALYALSRGNRKTEVNVATQAGIRKVSLRFDGDDVAEVSVALPYPKVLFSDHRILLGERFFHSSYISFGNPHCVVFTEELSDEYFLAYAPRLEKHPLFPRRANVEFAKIISENRFAMRTWERGCGETLSCSTGSAAAVYAAYIQELCGTRVFVEQPGGTITVDIDPAKDELTVSSQAKIVFWGEIPDFTE